MELPEITDDQMRSRLGLTLAYTVVLLQEGPRYHEPESRAIVWEHGRRNFALNAAGLLAVVCPVTDDSPWCGVGIFTGSVEQTIEIMEGDPGVKAGVFTYEAHPVRGFPGSALPGEPAQASMRATSSATSSVPLAAIPRSNQSAR
ncbi:MAG: hypothetical protein QOE24_846 [Frankiales bacterium]|jgi:hypothetical protein|nr:hypothetical protein [Frankiales bacterium]MDX6223461.1 hypothetical protein [Frankiales bacterium]